MSKRLEKLKIKYSDLINDKSLHAICEPEMERRIEEMRIKELQSKGYQNKEHYKTEKELDDYTIAFKKKCDSALNSAFGQSK